jgi:hypothetical protein
MDPTLDVSSGDATGPSWVLVSSFVTAFIEEGVSISDGRVVEPRPTGGTICMTANRPLYHFGLLQSSRCFSTVQSLARLHCWPHHSPILESGRWYPPLGFADMEMMTPVILGAASIHAPLQQLRSVVLSMVDVLKLG